MLNVINLTKSFGGNSVLKKFNYRFKSGKIYALMGANGSGKTTLLNIIGRFMLASSGQIIFKGKLLKNCQPSHIANMGIARTFQDLRLLTELTVQENLYVAHHKKPNESVLSSAIKLMSRIKSDTHIELMLERIHLADLRNQKAKNISYGQQKLLTLGMALVNNCELLLLDEPVAGVQPRYRNEIANIISEIKSTVIFIEHNPEFIEQVTNRVLFLDNGAIIDEGTYSDIRNNPRVQEVYL